MQNVLKKYGYKAIFCLFVFSFFLLFPSLLVAKTATKDSNKQSTKSKSQVQSFQAVQSLDAPVGVSTIYKSNFPVSKIAYSNSGQYIAAAVDNTVMLWRQDDIKKEPALVKKCELGGGDAANVLSLEFSGDSKYLLCAYDNGVLRVHSTATDVPAVTIKDTDSPIIAASYLIANYKIVAAREDNSLVECFQLVLTGDGTGDIKGKTTARVKALCGNAKTPLVLITTAKGTAQMWDVSKYEQKQSFDIDANTDICASFSKDGNYYYLPSTKGFLEVYATADNNLVCSFGVKKQKYQSFDLSFNNQAVALSTALGPIEIFDFESEKTRTRLDLPRDGDYIQKVCLSPEAQVVLVGTQNGYLYQYSLTGSFWDSTPAQEYTGEGTLDATDAKQIKKEAGDSPFDAIIVNLGMSTIPEDYYLKSYLLGFGYRHYAKRPYFFGVQCWLGMGFPDEDFPYKYYNDKGDRLYNPFLYEGKLGIVLGLVYYKPKTDFQLFCESEIGAAARMLCNNSINHTKKTKLYPGAFFNLEAGLGFKWFRIKGGFEFDSNVHLLVVGSIGLSIPLRPKVYAAPAVNATQKGQSTNALDKGAI